MNPLNVIFADDDDDDHFLIDQVLDEIGLSIQLFKAWNGVEVLNFLSNDMGIPDLILLDINMPLMDGIITLGHIRAKEKYQNVRIILFSTTADHKVVSDAYQLGANLYLRKPNKYDDYILLMKTLLTGADIPEDKSSPFIIRRG